MSGQGVDRTEINSLYYYQFKGESLSRMQKVACEWFDSIKNQKNFYIDPVIEKLRDHRKKGQEPVFVSGSSVDILAPLAKAWDVCHILANKQSSQNDILDGMLIPPQTIGKGKMEAISIFLKKMSCDAQSCFAYGDHISDLPMLEYVGTPFVVGNNPDLVAVATEKGWPIIKSSNCR